MQDPKSFWRCKLYTYRKNVALWKPLCWHKDDYVGLVVEECYEILSTINTFDYSSNSFITVRSVAAMSLITFCTRRGREPVRLHLHHWQIILDGEWVDQTNLPDKFILRIMFISYQTGKGSECLIAVIFNLETVKSM